MSINDSIKKINPVKDREGSQQPSVFNGVKQFLDSEKGKDILIVIIVILAGLGSFELGRLSKENESSGIKIEYPSQDFSQASNAIASLENSNILQNDKISAMGNSSFASKTFFASSRGTKYYSIGCSAGKTLKQENRIYFSSREEAEKAGYELSSSCK